MIFGGNILGRGRPRLWSRSGAREKEGLVGAEITPKNKELPSAGDKSRRERVGRHITKSPWKRGPSRNSKKIRRKRFQGFKK